MRFKKSLINVAVGAALSVSAASAHAVAVASWQLEDMDNDALISDFAFFSAPTGNSANIFGATGETGCTAAGDGTTCDPIAFDAGAIGTNVFTTGFNFGGTGVFAPNVTGTMSADITGTSLTFSALDFGGIFGGTQFFLAPDDLNAVNVESFVDNGDGTYGVVVRYIGTINDPGGSFHNFASNWRLEGTMTVVPVPAAVWLLGSGLIGLVGIARRKKARSA